jgi:hypothetical protein
MADGFNSALNPSAERRTTALESIGERCEVIDRATGMLTAIYDIDADDALGPLRRQSQLDDVEVYPLSTQIVADLVQASTARFLTTACEPAADVRSLDSATGPRR